MNLVVLTGRLTRDPEVRYGNNGKAYCRFSIAVDRPFKRDEADFINVVAFQKTAELVGEYFKKGNKIGVQGSLHMSQYEKDGEKRISYEVTCNSIEFMEGKKGESTGGSKPAENTAKPSAPAPAADSFDSDDEFPF